MPSKHADRHRYRPPAKASDWLHWSEPTADNNPRCGDIVWLILENNEYCRWHWVIVDRNNPDPCGPILDLLISKTDNPSTIKMP